MCYVNTSVCEFCGKKLKKRKKRKEKIVMHDESGILCHCDNTFQIQAIQIYLWKYLRNELV